MKRLLALLPLAIGVFAGPKTDVGEGLLPNPTAPTRYRIYCETTEGSPYLHHVLEAADLVAGHNGQCRQQNLRGSHCTKIKQGEGGVISICSPDGERDEIPCKDVADMARAVEANCRFADRAGGYVYREVITFTGWKRWPPSSWVEVTTAEG